MEKLIYAVVSKPFYDELKKITPGRLPDETFSEYVARFPKKQVK